MPKIEVSHKDLCTLIGRKLSVEQLADEILFAKGEIDEVSDDMLKLDLKDTNRPDMWSAEGVAREIKARKNPCRVRTTSQKPNFTDPYSNRFHS